MPVHDLEHPAGPLAARRALAAALVGEEPAGVVQHVDHAGLVVDDGDGRGAEAEAADLAGAVEVERDVELGSAESRPMLMPAGDDGLGLPALPDAAAVLLDQLAERDAQRQLDAAPAC